MAPARWFRCWLLAAIAVVVALSLLASPCSAVRPGGDNGVVLSKEGNVVQEDGTAIEEYEVGDQKRGGICLDANSSSLVRWSITSYLR